MKMAVNTDLDLRKAVIYSVFVRNHTEEGTFRALIKDLPRIKKLGADFVWLMPIHPLGVKNRKGSLGSPYAIRDYRGINEEYGTIEDFIALVDAIHDNGMKCMIDVVFNHTSPDSVLWETHPEYFYKNEKGEPGNRVGDWSDVIDLDYDAPGLADEQIETLKYWARYVDGFRCDVASFVPAWFWERARREVEEIRPGCVWLAESVHLSFGDLYRREGYYSAKDVELMNAFDIEYEYDVREAFDAYIEGRAPVSHWLDMVNFQEFAYPETYNKLRFLENHDQPRIASYVKEMSDLKSFTALQFFLKGTALVYAGQERACDIKPGLFDRETIDWETGRDISDLIEKLSRIRKEYFGAEDMFHAEADDETETVVCERNDVSSRKIGIFPLRSRGGSVPVHAPDGIYRDLISGADVKVSDGAVQSSGEPIIIAFPRPRPAGQI